MTRHLGGCPEMAIFRYLCVPACRQTGLPVRVPVCAATATGRRTQTGQGKFYFLKYVDVFLRVKFSPSLALQKISHSHTASYQKSAPIFDSAF